MPELGRTTPCPGCPWLRKSRAGHLGADTPEHFYRTAINTGTEMPCHMQIDYGNPDWEEDELPEADLCAGNLIYFKNNLKRPRARKLADAVDAVSTSPHVFSWPWEFYAHHIPGASEEEIKELVSRSQYPPFDDEDEDEEE